MSQSFTGKITDSEDNVSLYADKDLVQTCDSDKGRQKLVNSSISTSDCHIAHLSGFSKYLENHSEDTENSLEEKKVLKIFEIYHKTACVMTIFNTKFTTFCYELELLCERQDRRSDLSFCLDTNFPTSL